MAGVIAQPPNDLLRVVEPSLVRVAGCQHAVGHREGRRQIERGQQVCRRLVETAAEEVGFADSVQIGCPAIAGAGAQVSLEMLEREVGLPGKNPEQTAPVPPVRMTRV